MLEKYRRKRNFEKTTEPPPPAAPQAATGSLRFVVQKHDASRLHYDFRLEWDGALKSWAVPKGPSPNPQDKRLAVMVEDHPLPYASYEGVIADGNYGAGEVIVWDTGVYSPDEGGRLSFDDREEAERRMRDGLAAGKLSFTLRGKKLRGSWTLVKTARSQNEWLLIKHRDQFASADADILAMDRSVLSDLTLEDLKAGRMPEPAAAPVGREVRAGTPAPWPKAFRPMLATSVDKPFSHAGWLFEPKLDGFRALAMLREGRVTLLSRTGHDLTDYFPSVAEELAVHPQKELILDGEIVALNEHGIPDFQLLQNATNLDFMGRGGRRKRVELGQATVVYYPFDLLYLEGRSLMGLALTDRKRVLAQVLIPGDTVKPVDSVQEQGEAFFDAATRLGLEGMVAKRRDSTYQPGLRTKDWLKVKAFREQDFVVGGFTKGIGERASTFGALLAGYYEGDALHYAGRVGTGFDQATLKKLLATLEKMAGPSSPFDGPVEDVKAEEITWIRPELVARVKFAQFTADKRLRAPVYLGLRPDVRPADVGLEVAEPVRAIVGTDAPPKPVSKDAVKDVLEQLDNQKDKLILEVEGHRISLTNLNKVLWPAEADARQVTKRDMIRYYAEVGPYMVPHLQDRPLTLTRYPNGIQGESFYQKRWQDAVPEFAAMVRLFSSTNEGDVEYVMVNNLATLLWLAQLANIEFHPWLSRYWQEPDGSHLSMEAAGSQEAIEASVLNYPDFIVFDLDPYIYSGQEKGGAEPELNQRAFRKGVEIARSLKEILDQLSLSSFVKTSGKTGIHIYVPITRKYDFSVTRKTCEVIGRHLMELRPQEITMEWAVVKRTGKIFMDHNQNTRGKNMASIYSLRPHPNAPVSTPVTWEELEHIYPTEFTISNLPARLAQKGDLWAGILGAKHDLTRLLG